MTTTPPETVAMQKAKKCKEKEQGRKKRTPNHISNFTYLHLCKTGWLLAMRGRRTTKKTPERNRKSSYSQDINAIANMYILEKILTHTIILH